MGASGANGQKGDPVGPMGNSGQQWTTVDNSGQQWTTVDNSAYSCQTLNMLNPQLVAGNTVCLGTMSPKTFRLSFLILKIQ